MKCRICGKEFNKEYYSKPFENVCSSECFKEAYWLEIIKEKENHLIIDGKCYSIDDDDYIRKSCGKYKIQMNNGIIIYADKLWCQSEIPQKFRDILKDNAVFLEIK